MVSGSVASTIRLSSRWRKLQVERPEGGKAPRDGRTVLDELVEEAEPFAAGADADVRRPAGKSDRRGTAGLDELRRRTGATEAEVSSRGAGEAERREEASRAGDSMGTDVRPRAGELGREVASTLVRARAGDGARGTTNAREGDSVLEGEAASLGEEWSRMACRAASNCA